jgi:hypothetical protein
VYIYNQTDPLTTNMNRDTLSTSIQASQARAGAPPKQVDRMNEMKHMRDIHWINRLAETRSLGGELSAAPISANVPMSDGG